ncbi:transketolase [Nitrospirillum amazonense]|uniref:Transketolase n=1 Tax=Nitrospirillum amazonense TaxID=28077 RepID=A0A560KID5_9PROT|nr:transketolase [Nitrospirillum amazonense]MDG3444429.1 transketolase [Nitrospirillum amazonense]TWB82967.1 transketolase [Nitrospirillum amazonense]
MTPTLSLRQIESAEPDTPPDLADMANAVRMLAVAGVEAAKSGHPGMPMGMADVATVLFTRVMRIDPARPDWPDRDRFVLSAGHGSMLQYALHHLLGYPDMPIEELKRFRQLGSKAAGHPEHGHAAGIETTTGPLGQGITTAVGMALAERHLNARFGDALVDHRTYVIAGDGCLMEGISQEAIDLAGHLKLSRLVVLWDDNGISIDGATTLSTGTDQLARFKASGWAVERVDAYDHGAIEAALNRAQASDRPTLIACRSVIGYGAPTKAGTCGVHGTPLGVEEAQATAQALGWDSPPFTVPDDIRDSWRAVGRAGRQAREAWERRLAAHPARANFWRVMAAEPGADVIDALAAYRQELVESRPKMATRKASQVVLGVVNAATDLTVGGSADLTHSNLTQTKGMDVMNAGHYAGRYIHYGIREHAMAAVMNGLALHGGVIPYGGTFLVFSDYARGAIRLSALMGVRVIHVLTHDSIGLGEDGPTHQPVEHLAMLRATPNLHVFRPADAVETAECWELALTSPDTPSALCLSRQDLPTLRRDAHWNRSATGAYILRETPGPRDATLLATGSEVALAVEAAERLAGEGIATAVVSMPCWELFERQPPANRALVLGSAPRIGVEAAVRFGWDRWLGDQGAFIGMGGFGASAPAADLYRHFGITVDAIMAAVRARVAHA